MLNHSKSTVEFSSRLSINDYVIDHKELYKFKQRMNSDLLADVTKIVELVNGCYENTYKNRKNIDVNK